MPVQCRERPPNRWAGLLLSSVACLLLVSACSEQAESPPPSDDVTVADAADDAGGTADVGPDAPAPVPVGLLAVGASSGELGSTSYRLRLRVGGPAPSGRVQSPSYVGTLSIGPPEAKP